MLEHLSETLVKALSGAVSIVGQSWGSIAFAAAVLVVGLVVGAIRNRGAASKTKRVLKTVLAGLAIPVALWLLVLAYYVVVATPYQTWLNEHTKLEAAERALSTSKETVTKAAQEACSVEIAKRDNEITSLKQRATEKIALPPINVYAGGGPLPTYPFGPYDHSSYWGSGDTSWVALYAPVLIDWDQLQGYNLVARLTVTSLSPDHWAQAAVYCEEEKSMVLGPQTRTLEDAQEISIPRGSGKKRYVLWVRTDGAENAGVAAGGYLAPVRQ